MGSNTTSSHIPSPPQMHKIFVCILLSLAGVLGNGKWYQEPPGPPQSILPGERGRSKWFCNLKPPTEFCNPSMCITHPAEWDCVKCSSRCEAVHTAGAYAYCVLVNNPPEKPKWGCLPWEKHPGDDEAESRRKQLEIEYCIRELRCLPTFMCKTLHEEAIKPCLQEMDERHRRFPNALFEPPRACSDENPRCNTTVDALQYLSEKNLDLDIFRSLTGSVPDKTCLGDLGCFETQSCTMWIPLGRTLPKEEEIDEAKFVFTNPISGSQTIASLSMDRADTEEWKKISASLTPGKKLVIIIHGFGQNITNSTKFKRLRKAVLGFGLGDFTAEIDWAVAAHAEGGLFGTLKYDVAAGNAYVLGNILGDTLVKLSRTTGLALEDMTIVGFSLGGQIGGIAGRRVEQITRQKIGELIALDPAAPCFCEHSIWPGPDSAKVTRIIHTDVAVDEKVLGYGCQLPGRFSYYLNGAKERQPHCEERIQTAPIFQTPISIFGCSHNFALKYFIHHLESINQTKGNQCEIVGQHCKPEEDALRGSCSGRNITFRQEPSSLFDAEKNSIRVMLSGPKNSKCFEDIP